MHTPMNQLSIFSLALLLICLFFGSTLMAQPANIDHAEWTKLKEESKKHVEDIFQLAEYRDYDKFANMFLYSGRNEKRAFNDVLDYADPYEGVEVQNELNRVRHWVAKSESYELTDFRIVPGMKKDLYVWDIEFSKKSKVKKHKIYLTLLKDRYVFYRSE